MKKKVNVLISILVVIIVLIIIVPAQAQILHPVKWSYVFKKLNATEAVIMLKANIDGGWHLYSTVQPDGGPVKTSFIFVPSTSYNVTGTISEPAPITKYEKAFDMNVSYFENTVIFQQKVKLNSATTAVRGTLNFMVCNDQKCLPPETVSFDIPIK
jgi:hypothetical protein